MHRAVICALLSAQLAGPVKAEQVYSVERCRQTSAPLTEAIERLASEIGTAQDRSQPGRYDPIDRELVRQIGVARQQKQGYCLAELLRLRWHLGFQQDKLDAGEPYLTEALAQFGPSDRLDRQRLGVLGNLSYHYVLTGRFVEATRTTRELIAISIELQDAKSMATHYYLIADAYLRLGEVDTAQRYFERAFKAHSPSDGTSYYAALSKLATIDQMKGDYQSALKGHQQSLLHFQVQRSYRAIPASIEVARDLLALGQHELSEQYASLAWNDSRALLEQRIDAALVLFDSATKRHDQPAAERMRAELSELLDQAKVSSGRFSANLTQQFDFATLSVRYFAFRNELAQLTAVAREGLDLADRVSADASQSGVNPMAWRSRTDGLIEAIAGYLWDKDPTFLAKLLDRHSASNLALADFGNAGDQEFELLDQLAMLEQSLVDQQGSQPADVTKHTSDRRELAHQRDVVREAYIQVHNDRVRARRTESTPTAQHSPAFVPEDDEVLVRYYVRPSVSIALVSLGRSVTAVPLPSLDAITSMNQRAQQVIRDPNLPDVRAPLRALAALLPLETIKSANVRRVLLVTDESTFSVPFAAIDLGKDSQLYRPLGTEYELVQVSHLESYTQTSRNTFATTSAIAMFAAPTFSATTPTVIAAKSHGWLHNLPKLDFSMAEARRLRSLFAGRPLHMFLGANATAENLLSEQARNAHILHISTHGYFSPDLAHVVGLAVAGSMSTTQQADFVSQSQLLSRPFRNALIVLGSCDSLQGQRYRGIGSYGLGQALIQQGTPVVVGSLWEIPDASAAAFMTQFYQYLLASEGNTAYAMTQARSALIRGRVLAHPRHWAALTLLSRNRDIERRLLPDDLAMNVARPGN